MPDRRNPYLILGLDFGASPEEASVAFARVARRLRSGDDLPYSLDDATWALHEIEQAVEDPTLTVEHYRVPADPELMAGLDVWLRTPIPLARQSSPAVFDARPLERDAQQAWLADSLESLYRNDEAWAFPPGVVSQGMGRDTQEERATETPQPARTPRRYGSPPPMAINPVGRYSARIRTNMGEILVELLASESPITVNNFIFLSREGFYDGVIFHRVIQNFMVQGGDPTGTGTGGPGYTFDDELEAARTRGYRMGTLAMANSGPNTNGSQFFIMHADYGLPPNYSVFGKTIDGQDVVDDIATTETNWRDRPVEDVVIETIEIHEE